MSLSVWTVVAFVWNCLSLVVVAAAQSTNTATLTPSTSLDKTTVVQEFLRWQRDPAGTAATKKAETAGGGTVASERIFNGNSAEVDEFGYFARIVYVDEEGNPRFGCGGSIVSLEYVLTAAHCVWNFETHEPAVNQVSGAIVGYACDDVIADGTNCGQDFDFVQGKALILDHRWDPDSLYFDLALIQLVEPSAAGYAPIIPDDGSMFDQLLVGDTVTLIGFGNTNVLGGIPNVLQEVDLPLISTATCEEAWGQDMQGSTVCVDNSSGSVCKGDSGGPMIVRRNGVDTVIGVVSFGEPPVFGIPGVFVVFSCGVKSLLDGKPDVMARVSTGFDWIASHVCTRADFPAARPTWCFSSAVQTNVPVTHPTFRPIPNPTFRPIPNPTFVPIFNPTFAPISNPTFRPIPNPTFRPISNPTLAPVPNSGTTFTPISRPTLAPRSGLTTLAPAATTSPPVSADVASGTTTCANTNGNFTLKKKTRTCLWLEKQVRKRKTRKVLKSCGKKGADMVCPQTCGEC